MKDVLSSSILMLEGKNEQECQEYSKICVPCHLPIHEFVFSKLAIILDDIIDIQQEDSMNIL